ncbi:flagellar P-ring protein FlgI [Candidatus Endoriftia persephone str. Guaymas]|jgi:flagellar P-ring protein precursor FlgI|uniref:Flagellar P-ring protein n=3 Tax=Gammaproteobacteria TaxID=1236 RepID=G2FB47_9GAMM|nr:flagellar basal body P-ring protein FlgI [Candidatus Endoriftia persephone]EGW55985.1 flagellar P-ring protein FlgI [endosymbiont of Tevnia jerichonana (vent Tica)]MBA1331868.1 flagellar P-ring protein FlgI [Candidatus Endoriftia persephone str. Guaymas]
MTRQRLNNLTALLLLMSLVVVAAPVAAERIKDLASIQGVRGNQLIGYGLVVGLNGTGDKDTDSPYTLNSLRNMLHQFGVQIPAGTKIKPKNVAAVIVHGELPPFSKVGQRINVTVSSLGNAKSLRGGTLLMTPLKGADGNNYAMAQGNLVVGGLSAEGQDGSRITVNIPSAGRIPNGATVEREVPNNFNTGRYVTLNLHDGDFTTAMRLAESVNLTLGPGTAKPVDSTSIRVSAPIDPAQKVSFIAMLEQLEVQPGTAPARVIINSRTGTVVINSQVRVYPAAVSHGNLVVSISESAEVSQPGAFSPGQTTVVPQSDVAVEEQGGNHMFLFNPGVSLDEVVKAVNEVGAAPSDLVAILEALKEAGALRAELLVI